MLSEIHVLKAKAEAIWHPSATNLIVSVKMFFTVVMLTSIATRTPNSSDLIFSIAGDKGKPLLEIIRYSEKKWKSRYLITVLQNQYTKKIRKNERSYYKIH